MQYTKPMIDQVFQIRKAAPDHIRPQIKLANPNLLDFMADVYWQFHDKSLRDRIAQLMFMAGPVWLTRLEERATQTKPDQNQHIYRGQSPKQNETSTAPKSKTVIYRGKTLHITS